MKNPELKKKYQKFSEACASVRYSSVRAANAGNVLDFQRAREELIDAVEGLGEALSRLRDLEEEKLKEKKGEKRK